ncbi:MAG: phosphonate metabolism transcriptional regulator PhnF [Rhizobium sp. 60-20]|nr:MAG: phosphonate metabolism transcriptional regulator PhnF [Rhizobium sp. 60-20]RKD50703.1 GntR family transcriptional regulator [Rhizobium sp. WW_1]
MDDLLKDIRDGALLPGQKLPTETALAARFEVNVNTVRRALSHLQEKGIVRGERGSGTFVKDDTIRYPVSIRQEQGKELARLQRSNLRQVLAAKTLRASDEVAAALQIDAGSYVRRVETLSWADTRPFSVSTYFYPLPRYSGIDAKISEYGSITRALRDYGIEDYRRAQSLIRSKKLSVREAKLLQQSRTKPSIMAAHINIEPNGTPIQISVSVEAAWVELLFRFDGDAPDRAADLKFPLSN